MSTTGIYLNFKNQTEEAFNFYKTVFGGEFEGPIGRFKDIPAHPGMPALSEEDGNLVMHICLPILGGVRLMGTDSPESMGMKLIQGNNVHISLNPDTRAETDKLFGQLSDGGTIIMPLQQMFWGDYFGACVDKFGTSWMINCAEK